MKKNILALCVIGLSVTGCVTTTESDKTCGDLIDAYKSMSPENVLTTYSDGIGNMGMVDEIKYKKKFLEASPTDKKKGQPAMMKRASLECLNVDKSAKLATVIKKTM
tara:strand:- start:184 stop:504 length:321 start_codon:yes stop_codon:yes gene_type:complete